MLGKEVAAVKIVERLPWRRLSIVLDGQGWRRRDGEEMWEGKGQAKKKKRRTNKHNGQWTVSEGEREGCCLGGCSGKYTCHVTDLLLDKEGNKVSVSRAKNRGTFFLYFLSFASLASLCLVF